jgi:hypothetical protein
MARELEKTYAAERVATFLMRCLFTLFAEDVGLLPNQKFLELLKESLDNPQTFPRMVGEVWQRMNEGGFSVALRQDVLRFNGKLFEDADVLPLPKELIGVLIEAAKADWRDVEPAIFGTLLERALDPIERHKLGAHYTPRAYVERLVIPTVIEPLRADFENVRAAAVSAADKGDVAAAAKEVTAFHKQLCQVRILDPACGSGNFLYVAMEHMKRLEGEVIDLLRQLGESAYADYVKEMDRHAVDPHQFLGIEINPRAAAITELVLWIGYLQWHFRTRGRTMPAEPVLKKFNNIECRDAVLVYDREELVRDEQGKPLSRWDGRTFKRHPITGEQVPDETARVEIQRLINPRPATWPEADFIVGNPPYLGAKYLRSELGDGYVEALWAAYPKVPNSVDYVMYWWDKAAEQVRTGRARRFGFITTNSLPQTFSRRVVEAHLAAKPPLSIAFAIPDHPWVDTADGADVRVAMTVGALNSGPGRLLRIVTENPQGYEGHAVTFKEESGQIHAILRIGLDLSQITSLRANERLCSPGVKLHGSGFVLTKIQAETIIYGSRKGVENYIRPFIRGRCCLQKPRILFVIDLLGANADVIVREYPGLYQWLLERVYPERIHNNRLSYRENWFLFGEPRKELRSALKYISKFISTVATAKHRVFFMVSADVIPDDSLINIALSDLFYLSVLSSSIHVKWAIVFGGTLEDRPRYNKTKCFDPFPFPECDEAIKSRIRDLGRRSTGIARSGSGCFPT